jgi:hypothetical protein
MARVGSWNKSVRKEYLGAVVENKTSVQNTTAPNMYNIKSLEPVKSTLYQHNPFP